MGDIAIRVENLGKKYKIGSNQTRYQTLRESIVNGLSNSIERIKGSQPKEDNIIWALKDINFEVKHGEVLGIIGRNGAGKSTLLKILARITRPTTGRFELKGRVGSLLEVGTGFHQELTGRDNIYLSGAILGMQHKEINRKFDEIVDFAEIEKFLDTPVKHYSSGMYMRLAFSVAAHLEPMILLVDEVLAVGDAEFQNKCLGKMGDVAGEGRTVLFVSHNMGMINSLCQRAILLNSGKILLDGIPFSAISKYFDNGMNSPYSVDYSKSSHKIGDMNSTLLQAYIENENGVITGDINILSSFKVKMKYQLHNAVPKSPFPNFHFYNSQGQFVFVSHGNRDIHTNPNGVYEATCVVPGSLLNNDTYFIGLALTFTHNGFEDGFWQRSELSVTIRDSIDESYNKERQIYNDTISGVIRPNLKWEIIQIT